MLPITTDTVAQVAVNQDGSIRVWDGVTQVEHPSEGVYTLMLNPDYDFPLDELMCQCVLEAPDAALPSPAVQMSSGSEFTIRTYSLDGSPQDWPWNIQVFRVMKMY